MLQSGTLVVNIVFMSNEENRNAVFPLVSSGSCRSQEGENSQLSLSRTLGALPLRKKQFLLLKIILQRGDRNYAIPFISCRTAFCPAVQQLDEVSALSVVRCNS